MGKTIVDLSTELAKVDTTLDNVVMPLVLETIENGRGLDVSDYAPKFIKGGHVIIKKDGEAIYKPMPVKADGSGYEALPAGYSYNSFLYGSIETRMPLAALMIRGTFVTEASPYPVADILADLKTALPLVTFKTKED